MLLSHLLILLSHCFLMLLVTVTQVLVVEDSDIEQDDNSEDATRLQQEAPPSSAAKGAQSHQEAPCSSAAKGPGTGASGRLFLTSLAAQAAAATAPSQFQEGDKENVAPGDMAQHSGGWQGSCRAFWWVAGQLQHILVGTQDVLAGHSQGRWVAGHSQWWQGHMKTGQVDGRGTGRGLEWVGRCQGQCWFQGPWTNLLQCSLRNLLVLYGGWDALAERQPEAMRVVPQAAKVLPLPPSGHPN